MKEFKGTKGKWKRVLLEETDFYTRRNEINCGKDGECIAEFVHNDYDALIISKAPEMLELLEKVLIHVDWSYKTWTSNHGLIIEEEIKKLIKEAIEI